MEDHSPVDISIRNLPVRLTESNVDSELNGESMKSMFIPSSSKCDSQRASFNDDLQSNSSFISSNDADEICDKLNVDCDNADNCDLINGCNQFMHDDMKCVHISVNGLKKCNDLEFISAHLEHLNNRTSSEHLVSSTDVKRTESKTPETTTVNSIEKIIHLDKLCLENSENDQHSVTEKLNVKSVANLVAIDVNYEVDITYLGYDSESQMPDIMRLIQKDLSEPYSIYTYRYFIHNWPKLCFLAQHDQKCVGAIVCKLDIHKKHSRRGYIAMLAVDEKYRKRRIGSNLVLKAIKAMVDDNADEVVLETEITNKPALRLYENLGFVRDKRLFRYYLNGVDALRLKLWLR